MFEIFFFHVMTDVGDGGEFLEWTYYLVSRYKSPKRAAEYFKANPSLGHLWKLVDCLDKKLLNLKIQMYF